MAIYTTHVASCWGLRGALELPGLHVTLYIRHCMLRNQHIVTCTLLVVVLKNVCICHFTCIVGVGVLPHKSTCYICYTHSGY